MYRNHFPVDPQCPEVKRFVSSLFDDPMTAACGAPTDEILDAWEQRHLSACKRCREYAAANIEVVD
jgi:hypothetical protein